MYDIDHWLSRFALEGCLHGHVAHVVGRLPTEVRDDLLGDPNFRVCDVDPRPGVAYQVAVGVPTATGGCRSVVLKRALARRDPPFIRWLIAHELAHAFLRNEGRFPGDDPESAADALAAQWGFPRP